MQSQHIKMSCISKEWAIWKGNYQNNSIYNSIKKKKTTEEVKDSYNKNYKTLQKELKKT